MRTTTHVDQSTANISALVLLNIILLEGFVTISVEILSIRQLVPFVGNNVIVTSLIIGIFLLFLALGYLRGGAYRSHFRQTLKNNFTKALIFLGIGLSYTFAAYFFDFFFKYLFQNTLIILTFYLLLIIAPIVYILGQTVPITTNLFKRDVIVGAISGKVLYISTLGSFSGAVLTSLLLFNFVGVGWTVFINAAILTFLVLLMLDIDFKDITRLLMLVLALFAIYILNVRFENIWFLHTNNYANYAIQYDTELEKDNPGDALVVNNSISSFVNYKRQGAPYVELMKKIVFKNLKLKNKTILILGAGGFTFGAENDFGNRLIYVDIDKDIKKFVEKYYLEKINGEFVAADARVFVKDKKSMYDVIISDVYKSRIIIPTYLLTREHLFNVYRALKPNGFVLFNLIASPLLKDAYSKRIDNTINSVFTSCMKIPMNYVDEYTNIIYVCSKNKRERDKTIYTDNLNSATLDFFKTY